MDAQVSLLDQLFDAGLLIDTGVDGLYGRSGLFEEVIARFDALITSFGREDGAEVVRFPPGMNRAHFERSGYLKSFPQLAGTVHCFCGDDAAHADLLQRLDEDRDWSGKQEISDVVLTPAACYPLYPMAAKRGALPENGRLFDLLSYCFRHEPSRDPARMQMFRMREYVRMGTRDEVLDFRESWLARGRELISLLELPFEVDVANDPFFGRAGRMMKNSQRDQGLKFELLAPVNSAVSSTACLSFNYHQDHFGQTWGLRTAGGDVAHTACVGFGMERVALALFRHHGVDVEAWPRSLRRVLWG